MLEMTLEIADRAARGALAKAATMNIAMTVSVVDEAGRLVVTMKGDRTGFLIGWYCWINTFIAWGATSRLFTELLGLQETKREGQSVYLRLYEEFGTSHFIILIDDLPTLNRFCAEVVPAFA